jgi:hypothetical protein
MRRSFALAPFLALFLALSLWALPAAHAAQPYTGITGGVGAESRAAMMSRYEDFNLHLAFANPGGQFLADVRVIIRDHKGSVVYDGPSTGPYLFIEVPPGTYRITAQQGDARAMQTAVASDAPRGITYFHLR